MCFVDIYCDKMLKHLSVKCECLDIFPTIGRTWQHSQGTLDVDTSDWEGNISHIQFFLQTQWYRKKRLFWWYLLYLDATTLCRENVHFFKTFSTLGRNWPHSQSALDKDTSDLERKTCHRFSEVIAKCDFYFEEFFYFCIISVYCQFFWKANYGTRSWIKTNCHNVDSLKVSSICDISFEEVLSCFYNWYSWKTNYK